MASLAQRVCGTCKARKKGCDKNLPGCGYCARRGLVCRYDEPAVIGWRVPSATSSWGFSASSVFGSLLTVGVETTLNSVIHMEVCLVLQSSSMSLDTITKRYFEGIHKWLPVVSPALLHEAIANAHLAIPASDFSLLLFTICLITLNSPVGDLGQSSVSESLYITAKTLFAQVQAVFCASTRLAQAGLLITAYEYASGRLEAAYITIGICARICYSLGLDKEPSRQECNGLSLNAIEEWNLWWGVVILERYVHW